MEEMINQLQHVSGPATLIAYLAALGAWSYVLPYLTKINAAREHIRAIPSKPPRLRIEALALFLGSPIPPKMTAEEWIRNQRASRLLVGYIATVVAALMTVIWVLK